MFDFVVCLQVRSVFQGYAKNLEKIAHLMQPDLQRLLDKESQVGGFIIIFNCPPFQEMIEVHFRNWGLTDAERDVALLSIKGLPIADIATMRATRAGTIKAQSAAIYRKAGVSSRAELISVVIEDLIMGLDLTLSAHPVTA
jgi:DNA-binding NarL/FixJ family response regulator